MINYFDLNILMISIKKYCVPKFICKSLYINLIFFIYLFMIKLRKFSRIDLICWSSVNSIGVLQKIFKKNHKIIQNLI